MRYRAHIRLNGPATHLSTYRNTEHEQKMKDASVRINGTVLESVDVLCILSATNLHAITTAPYFKDNSRKIRRLEGLVTFSIEGEIKDSCIGVFEVYYYMQQKHGPARKTISVGCWRLRCGVTYIYWMSNDRTT